MRTLQILKSAVLVVLLVLSSCSSDDDNKSTPNPPGSGPFVATVDGTAFPAANMSFTKAKYVESTKMLQIIGQPTGQTETIFFNLMPFGTDFTFWQPGTYNFNPANVASAGYLASAQYNKWNGSAYEIWNVNYDLDPTGQIVIESITDTHVKGTFYFNAVRMNNDGTYDSSNVVEITQGSFDLDIERL